MGGGFQGIGEPNRIPVGVVDADQGARGSLQFALEHAGHFAVEGREAITQKAPKGAPGTGNGTRGEAGSKARLSLREHRLMAELAAGLLYKEIADKFRISIGNVGRRVHEIFVRLGARNRIEAIEKWKALQGLLFGAVWPSESIAGAVSDILSLL